jgi:hypothetical protein
MPMLQSLYYVDHVERSPCHKFSLAPNPKRVVLQMLRTELVDTPTFVGTPLLREYLNAEVRDYLNANPANCGIT